MRPIRITTLTLPLLLLAASANAETTPLEIQRFVQPGSRVVALAYGDVNGDETEDVVLVTEKYKPGRTPATPAQRGLLVLVRDAAGTLWPASKNDNVVLCATCAETSRDPFDTVEVSRREIKVVHRGGLNNRWRDSVTFVYSTKDKTWNLDKMEKTTYSVFTPSEQKTTVHRPSAMDPRISLDAFDRRVAFAPNAR